MLQTPTLSTLPTVQFLPPLKLSETDTSWCASSTDKNSSIFIAKDGFLWTSKISFEIKTELREVTHSVGNEPSPFATATLDVTKTSRAYNDTRFWREYTLKAVRLYRSHPMELGGLLPIPCKRVVKYGLDVQLAEATALRFVRKHTTIPVPKVHCSFEHKNVKYIVMDRIDGEEIGKVWSERSEAERVSLLLQLRGCFEQLRNIPYPHPGAIAAVDMQELYEPRTYRGEYGFGPFATE